MKLLVLPVLGLQTLAHINPRANEASENGAVNATVVSSSDLEHFDLFAQYAGTSYCFSSAAAGIRIECLHDVCPTVTRSGPTVHSTFAGPLSDIRGLTTVDTTISAIVVSIRGSSSVRNWLANVDFPQVPCDGFFPVPGCAAHAGFLSAFREIGDQVLADVRYLARRHPGFSVVVTGHSLGGAIATLVGASLRIHGVGSGGDNNNNGLFPRVDTYTYGAPRVGNEALTSFIAQQQLGHDPRLPHFDDPVPRVPPLALGFRHTSPEYWLAAGPADRVDYGAADIRVCRGYANTSCNAGGDEVSIAAHLRYLRAISSCDETFEEELQGLLLDPEDDGQSIIAGSSGAVVSDEELEAYLLALSRLDKDLDVEG